MNSYVNLRKILLASSSPRRKHLLEDAGFWIEVITPEYVEEYSPDMPLFKVAEHLAIQKAESARSFRKDDDILLTADSIVVLNNKIFGKPKDHTEAYHMLASLSGKMHRVDTGVCLMDQEKSLSFTASSEVYFRELNHEEINWYIQQYAPFDKAGSYAVQEWIGLCKISHIGGSHANIMGLPTDLVYEGLKSFAGAIAFP